MPSNAQLDRTIILLALSKCGYVTYQQLRALGITDNGVASRLRSGNLERVVRGVYQLPGYGHGWTRTAHARCLAGGPDAVLSHDAAARLFALDLPSSDVIEITVGRSRYSRHVPGELV